MDLIIDGVGAKFDATLILAHSAGQPANSVFMENITKLLTASSVQPAIRVVRFNFPYMEQAVKEGKNRPPSRAPSLLESWREVIKTARQMLQPGEQLFIGGKSMGGRMATMVAVESKVDGVVCLGYPFHPPGKPEKLRTEHLEELNLPVLICQGERDPFGNLSEIDNYSLPEHFSFCWLGDGDHSFKPRKSSGFTLDQNLARASSEICLFIKRSL
ncbi:MAG: putative alpha/beta-hydrolase family hydrolase [Parasphingorhabdus sp.]|jgi:predicted alpha/beta-hydrolase family hydrolase